MREGDVTAGGTQEKIASVGQWTTWGDCRRGQAVSRPSETRDIKPAANLLLRVAGERVLCCTYIRQMEGSGI